MQIGFGSFVLCMPLADILAESLLCAVLVVVSTDLTRKIYTKYNQHIKRAYGVAIVPVLLNIGQDNNARIIPWLDKKKF